VAEVRATAAAPAAPTALLQANSCTGCHAVDAKIVGPAFREIARRYAGRADAVDYLAAKIRSGGQGVWGSIPMPAQGQLKTPEAAAIAAWLADGAN
jgi:cytochrome c